MEYFIGCNIVWTLVRVYVTKSNHVLSRICQKLITKTSPIAVYFCKRSAMFILQREGPIPKPWILHCSKLLVPQINVIYTPPQVPSPVAFADYIAINLHKDRAINYPSWSSNLENHITLTIIDRCREGSPRAQNLPQENVAELIDVPHGLRSQRRYVPHQSLRLTGIHNDVAIFLLKPKGQVGPFHIPSNYQVRPS